MLARSAAPHVDRIPRVVTVGGMFPAIPAMATGANTRNSITFILLPSPTHRSTVAPRL